VQQQQQRRLVRWYPGVIISRAETQHAMVVKHSYLVSVLVLLVAGYCTAALASATATTFIVGDDQGWTMTGVDYVAWVQGKTFATGDKLGESSANSALHAWFIASPALLQLHTD